MKCMKFLLIVGLVCLMMMTTEGRRGGGGGGRGGGGRGGGGFSRSAGHSPSFSRSSPSRSYRPAPSRSYSSAARSTPRSYASVGRTPSFSRSTQRPGGSYAQRPSTPSGKRYSGSGYAQRPASPDAGRYRGGATYRPGGGAGNRPSSRELGNFLNMPTQGGPGGLAGNRPSQLPANRRAGGLAGLGGEGGPGRSRGVSNAGRLTAGAVGIAGANAIGRNRPSQLPARGDRNGWNSYRNNRANNVRNLTQNNFNYNRYGNRPGGWWGGGYGHGFAHGWSASNAYRNWGGYWGWHGWPSGYWWGVGASAVGLAAWGAGSLFADHHEPVYYDYGNTVYVDNSMVYREGEPLASEQEYATQAIDYANVPVPEPPPISEAGSETPEQDAAILEYGDNWMPLGVFAVVNEKVDHEPSHYLQLAVSKEGYIAGTCYNSIKDETLPITGSVDKKSQRAAWKLDDNPDVVMETGIFNLSQDTAPALLHFGKDKTETRLLVRMEKPKQQ